MKSIILISIGLFLVPLRGISQSQEPQDISRTTLINVAKEIMTSAGTCALITLDEEGRPRARTMDPFLPENDLAVWFGSNPKSRKIDQIKNDPRVTLYYLDSDASGYVTIHGIAQIVDDPEEKENRWKEAWKAYYPNKPEGYVLVKVSPQRMEVISEARGIVGDTITWQPPAILFDTKK